MWQGIRMDATEIARSEPLLSDLVQCQIMAHPSLESALGHVVGTRLADDAFPLARVRDMFTQAMEVEAAIVAAVRADIRAACERDPACHGPAEALLFYKGVHALVIHRIAHWLWRHGRRSLARWCQSRSAERLGVDIHPAARIGQGILLDHAHGIVIGETAVVEDDVSLLHNVTLGGTGKHAGDRHPKVRSGVLIGAGALILGNIEIGRGAKVGAGSVLMVSVPSHVTAAGMLARVVGRPATALPALEMNQRIEMLLPVETAAASSSVTERGPDDA
jgi:serine O-acetyltransferase